MSLLWNLGAFRSTPVAKAAQVYEASRPRKAGVNSPGAKARRILNRLRPGLDWRPNTKHECFRGL